MPRVADETYEALRAAATRLLAEEGPTALTVRRIASEAGVSTMNVYSRFGGKEGIVDELFVDGFERLAAAMAEVDETDDPVADLQACGQNYRRFAQEHPTSYSVMFDAAVPDFEPSEPSMETAMHTLGLLIGRVQRVIDAGRMHGDAGEIAVALWATNHGLVSLERKKPEGMGIDWPAVHRSALDAVIRGYSVPVADRSSRR